MNRSVSCLAAALLCAAPACFAQEPERPSLDLEASFFNQYVWRGLVLTDGPVFQTSSTLGYKGAHVNLWTNQDLNDVNGHRGKFNEVDFDFGYERSFGKVTLCGGLMHYTFPNTPFAATSELYAGLSLDVPLQPSVKVFRDVDEIDGAYVSFDVAHSVVLKKLGPKVTWSADLSGGVAWGSSGYNRGYFGVDKSGMVDFHPAVALPLALGEHWKLTPRLAYGNLIDGDVRRTEVLKVHNFFAGVSLGFSL